MFNRSVKEGGRFIEENRPHGSTAPSGGADTTLPDSISKDGKGRVRFSTTELTADQLMEYFRRIKARTTRTRASKKTSGGA